MFSELFLWMSGCALQPGARKGGGSFARQAEHANKRVIIESSRTRRSPEALAHKIDHRNRRIANFLKRAINRR
jgi:hypothetical protein